MSDIPDLASMLTEAVLAGERKGSPSSSPRLHASFLGHPCKRWLYYKRTCGELETEVPDSLRLVFREGYLHERDIYAILGQPPLCNTIQVVATQVGATLPGNISGACDAVVRVRVEGQEGMSWDGPYVLEIKSVSPNIWGQYNTPEDFNKHPWSVRYVPQVHAYMCMVQLWLDEQRRIPGDVKGAIFLLKNKGTGAVKQVFVPRDENAELLLMDKAESVEGAVLRREPPDRIPWCSMCAECSFGHVCLPAQAFDPQQSIRDEGIEDACWMVTEFGPEVREQARAIEDARDTLKTFLLAMPEATAKRGVMVGDPPDHAIRLSKTAKQCRLIVERLNERAAHAESV